MPTGHCCLSNKKGLPPLSQKLRLPTDSRKEQHTNIIEFSNSRHRSGLQSEVTPKRDVERLQASMRALLILHSNLNAQKKTLEALQTECSDHSGEHSDLMELVRQCLGMLENLNILPLHEKALELAWLMENSKAR